MSCHPMRWVAFAASLSFCAMCPADQVKPGQDDKPSEQSLVVLDKHCQQMVEPFGFTETLTQLAIDKAKGWLGKLDIPLLGAKPEDALTDIRLKAKRSNWLPMKTEVLYGERLHAQETNILSRDSRIGKRLYPVADAMFADIMAKIGEQHPYNFQLFILKNSSRNAIARPGGFLYVDQGLLDDEEQWPKAHFAIAHEVAHVLQRHETRELQGLIVDSFGTAADIKKAIAKSAKDPEAVLANVKVGKDSYTRHHADQELQADSCSARLLSRVYTERGELAQALDAFLNDLSPMDTEPIPAVAATDAPAATDDASDTLLTKDAKKIKDAAQLAKLSHSIVTEPAARHPNTKERTENLKAMHAELTAPVTVQDAALR